MKPQDRKPLGKAGLLPEEARAIAEGRAELDLQSDIAGYLRPHEIEYIKPDGRKKSHLPKGWPDFTFAWRGAPVGMEVKTATGQLSSDQVKRHEMMSKNGWRSKLPRAELSPPLCTG